MENSISYVFEISARVERMRLEYELTMEISPDEYEILGNYSRGTNIGDVEIGTDLPYRIFREAERKAIDILNRECEIIYEYSHREYLPSMDLTVKLIG